MLSRFFYIQLLLGLALISCQPATAAATTTTTTTRYVRINAIRSSAAAAAASSKISPSEAILNNGVHHRNLGLGSSIAGSIYIPDGDSIEGLPIWMIVVIALCATVVIGCFKHYCCSACEDGGQQIQPKNEHIDASTAVANKTSTYG